MTRLCRHDGDFTARRAQEILHAADDPATTTRRMIAELEGALAQARAIASERLRDHDNSRRRLAEARLRHETWREKAEVALAAGREDLARAALVEKQAAVDKETELAGHDKSFEDMGDFDIEIGKIQSLLHDLKAHQALPDVRGRPSKAPGWAHNMPVRRRLKDA